MRLRLTVLAALAVLVGCGDKPQPAPAKSTDPASPVRITLALNWYPEAEHGGFYAAHVRGYYREVGLEVDIVPGGPGSPVPQRVAQGQVDFGVVNADRILLARAQETPIVAIMAPLQHSPRCIMVHAAAEIEDFKQLGKLKTLALDPGPAESAFLKKKLDLSAVEIVPYPGNVNRFVLDGPTYGQQAYSISEPFAARQRDTEPRCLMVSSLGYDPYTSVLVASEKLLAERPDVARRLVAASARGWADYLASWQATNGEIHARNSEMSVEILEFGAKELKVLVDASGGPIGRMELARWQKLTDQLVELELMKPGAVDPSKVYSADYLPAAGSGSR